MIRPLLLNTGLGAGDVVNLGGDDLNLTAGSAAMTDINTLVARGVQVEYVPQRRPYRVRYLSDPPKAASFIVDTRFRVFRSSGTPRPRATRSPRCRRGRLRPAGHGGPQGLLPFRSLVRRVTTLTRSYTNVSADATVTAEFLNVHESQGDPGCF